MQAVQILTTAVVFVIAFIGFSSFGQRGNRVFVSSDEMKRFDKLISGYFGTGAVVSAIFGAITSLATVYVFFLGSSKLFGWAIFFCIAPLLVSYRFTNWLTESIVSRTPRLQALYADRSQTASSISMLFWDKSSSARQTAAVVKYVSLASSISVIWLEFTVFADMSGYISDLNLAYRCATFFVVSFLVMVFISRFGLRGFAIADIYLGPIVVIGSICVLLGIVYAYINSNKSLDFETMLSPAVSITDLVMFICHVLILNSCIVVVSEGHWLRRWVFGIRETTWQSSGTVTTSIIWVVLISAGLLGSYVSGLVGELSIAEILKSMTEDQNPIFLIAFWAAATAALFSVCDAQIYSVLVVYNFDTKSGYFHSNIERTNRSIIWILLVALSGSMAYGLIKYYNIQVEKLIFVLIPLSTNLLPALIAQATGRYVSHLPIIASLFGFATLSIIGLRQPEMAFTYTLAAIAVPVLISFYIYYFGRPKRIF